METKQKAIDRDEVLKWLSYDRETGEFRWRRGRPGSRGAGRIAGSINKSNGYRIVFLHRVPYRASHLAWLVMNNEWPVMIDHKNGNRSDDRIDNLRKTTHRENTLNRAVHRSGHLPGTSQSKFGTWIAQITVDGEHYHLGTYATQDDAHRAWLDERKRLGV